MTSSDLLNLHPVPTLLSRVRQELATEFPPGKPVRVSRAPGRLDVMGGIADYTGSLVCEATLDRAAAVALGEREDRNVQVFSFNLLDEHRPFTLRVPLDTLASADLATLRREFAEPGRGWAGYLVGCLYLLHEQGYVNLADPAVKGLNLALLSDVPLGAGVSSSAAIEVATMMNLCAHFGIDGAPGVPPRNRLQIANCKTIDPMKLAAMCQAVENRVVGAPCGIMDQVSSCYGQAGALLRMVCQPHNIQEPLFLPEGIRAVGINSNVKHSVGGGMYGKTRCAAFMGHTIILDKMRQMGAAAGKTLAADPMNGYLANLDPDDYKRLFRPFLPEVVNGEAFIAKHGGTIDTATAVDPNVDYHVQHAADHHVLEARRVRNFTEFLEQAAALPATAPGRKLLLDKAGHLMYASHLSYTNDAMLGADECDLLVKLARDREPAGLYGAKITGGGSGGTVAILCDTGSRADAALAEIMDAYQQQTGKKPDAFLGSSPGAWHAGTASV
jgi:L-arabinokinase